MKLEILNKMTRKEKVAKLTRDLIEGGWSSVYEFVDNHAKDDDLYMYKDEDEEDEDKSLHT